MNVETQAHVALTKLHLHQDYAPDIPMEPPAWTERAACVGVADPDMFFPIGEMHPTAALTICAACPVRNDCLAWTLSVEAGKSLYERHGVFGGLTPLERVKLAGATAA